MSEYELYHHGVKGMKWGVRRTKAQLGHKVKKLVKKTKKVVGEAIEKKKAEEVAKKKAARGIHELSDAELRERINRLTLEKNVLDLQSQISRLTPQKISAGQKFAEKMGPVLFDAGKKVFNSYIDKAIKDAMGEAAPKDPLKDLKDSVSKLELQSREAKAKQQLTIADEFFKKRELETAQELANEAQRARAARYLERKRHNHGK